MSKATIALCAAIALSGCNKKEVGDTAASGPLRIALARDCMAHLPAGPVQTHYNDWAEVVAECDTIAWYQTNQCKGHEAACLAQVKEPKP